MSEINLIMPYCCITGKYCVSNIGFQEGYLIGISILLILISLFEYTSIIIDTCRDVNESDEVENKGDNKEDVKKYN